MKEMLKKVLLGRKVTVLAVAVTLMLVGGSTALAGTGVGGIFNLGQVNTVNAMSRLVGSTNDAMLRVANTDTGSAATALDLRVTSGKPPMTVNSSTKVKDLNADKIDGKDSTEFPRTVSNTIEPVYGTPTDHSSQPLLTLPTGDRIEWGCYRNGSTQIVDDVTLTMGSGGNRRTVFAQEQANYATYYENYYSVSGGLAHNGGGGGNTGRSVDTFTLRTTTMSSPSPFVATVEVAVVYRDNSCQVSAQAVVSGGV